MALETLRANKMRSGLTVLGVVIGITSIVGMTSLIRGFDSSLRASIEQLGPNTIYLSKLSIVSISGGAEFDDLMRRPSLTVGDAEAIERLAPSVRVVDIMVGEGPQSTAERAFYRGERTSSNQILGVSTDYATISFMKLQLGRFFTEAEVTHRRRVVVLGDGPYQVLFGSKGIDPINKKIRLGAIEYTVIGVMDKRPSLGSLDTGQDNLAIIPYTTHQVVFNIDVTRPLRDGAAFGGIIGILPRDDAAPGQALAEVEEIMRVRHGLKLDEPNDFDIITQDALLRTWEQISRAVLLALVVISSIALMVGGIGVMAIMMISVTERTREIGVRKALGARRAEILVQFLAEAATLTSVGGILGIVIGAGIGIAVNLATGFPVSLPLWAFAMGLGFSATVGIVAGMVPAVRASRLDPIEALRYE
ncbi:MAG TPA: ABC transporter permease [Vicinamibacterales bacterium]|nr:ABC transporter permease [Vicinamibacterales bacterium]